MSNTPILPQNTPIKIGAWCIDPKSLRSPLSCVMGNGDPAPTISVSVRLRLFNDADENTAIDFGNDVFFTLDWSSGLNGCSTDCQTVDFDAIDGSSATVQATGVTLHLNYPPFTGGANNIASVERPALAADMSVGIGTSSKAGVAASLQRTIVLTAAGEQIPQFNDMLIPKWARSGRLINTAIATPTAQFSQKQSNQGNIVSNSQIGKGSIDCVTIARGLGARWFTLLDAVALQPGAAVVFDLCPN